MRDFLFFLITFDLTPIRLTQADHVNIAATRREHEHVQPTVDFSECLKSGLTVVSTDVFQDVCAAPLEAAHQFEGQTTFPDVSGALFWIVTDAHILYIRIYDNSSRHYLTAASKSESVGRVNGDCLAAHIALQQTIVERFGAARDTSDFEGVSYRNGPRQCGCQVHRRAVDVGSASGVVMIDEIVRRPLRGSILPGVVAKYSKIIPAASIACLRQIDMSSSRGIAGCSGWVNRDSASVSCPEPRAIQNLSPLIDPAFVTLPRGTKQPTVKARETEGDG